MADIHDGLHSCSMRAIIVWYLLAIVAALGCFAIRLGVPAAFDTQNDMTIEDASIRAVLVFVATFALGLWCSRRQEF